MKTVLLVAVGGIGFRHFQAILNCKQDIVLYVVDINDEALKKAKEYADSIGSSMEIHYSSDSSNAPEHIDVAVIATSSKPRRKVFEELISSHAVDNIIFEKVLFPCVEDYETVDRILKEKNINAYVDCIAREYPVYQKIKNESKNCDYFIAYMKGSEWGLACNAIHLIDQAAYMSGADTSDVSCVGLLEDAIYDSKRAGYIEFYGKLIGKIGNKCKYLIECDHGSDPLTFEFFTDRYYYRVDESAGELTKVSYDNGEIMRGTAETYYVSQLTNHNIDKILKGEKIELPKFSESRPLHESMLRVFIDHMNKVNNTCEKSCPIT